jgi:hypothetical protein
MDAWNTNVSAGVISLAVSFSRRAGILSGPVALCGFKLVNSFMKPLWWIIIGGISGVELTHISGMLLRSSDVKTDENSIQSSKTHPQNKGLELIQCNEETCPKEMQGGI